MALVCSIGNCNKPFWAKTWCNSHYRQWHRQGDPLMRTRFLRTKNTSNLCTFCKIIKPALQFPLRQNGNRYSWCKSCSRSYRLKFYYKLTIEDFQKLLKKQNNKCAGCKQEFTDSKHNNGKWNIDHDHICCLGEKSCGKCVRGILCPSCNRTIGNAKDNPTTLRHLANYLEAFK